MMLISIMANCSSAIPEPALRSSKEVVVVLLHEPLLNGRTMPVHERIQIVVGQPNGGRNKSRAMLQ